MHYSLHVYRIKNSDFLRFFETTYQKVVKVVIKCLVFSCQSVKMGSHTSLKCKVC